MLVIVMHNNEDYLKSLIELATKEGIKDIRIIKQKGIGTHLLGGNANFIFRKGALSNAYDKAFVAVIREEDKTAHFLDLVDRDTALGLANLEDRGFICTVPFLPIRH